MEQLILGIDPGLKGAFAFLDRNRKLQIFDMPLKSGHAKKEISPILVAQILAPLASRIKLAAIERVHAFPGQGVSSTFTFGYSTGAIHGALGAFNRIPLTVPPNVWKGALGLTRSKGESIKRARALFPKQTHLFSKASHDGRAEAALIAYYAVRHFEPDFLDLKKPIPPSQLEPGFTTGPQNPAMGPDLP